MQRVRCDLARCWR